MHTVCRGGLSDPGLISELLEKVVEQPFLAFTQVENYRPPSWPDDELPKQAHLELGVDDLDAAQAEIIALGAREAPLQAGPHRWRVLLDPAGHPFCINVAV